MTKHLNPSQYVAMSLRGPARCSEGTCANRCARKATDEPHTLCEEHRKQMNESQRSKRLKSSPETGRPAGHTRVAVTQRVRRSGHQPHATTLRDTDLLAIREQDAIRESVRPLVTDTDDDDDKYFDVGYVNDHPTDPLRMLDPDVEWSDVRLLLSEYPDLTDLLDATFDHEAKE